MKSSITPQPTISTLRLPKVVQQTGRSRASLYSDINEGTFPPPIKYTQRCVAWPDYEVNAIVRARIAGKSDDEIRCMVAEMIEARSRILGEGGQ